MRAINPSRIATNIFQRANRFNFCVGFAPADPRKHTTMHHYINDMYLDLWEYGNYPDWVHIGSIPPRTYEPQVVDTLASTLNAQLGTNISADFLNSKRNRLWSKFISKDLNSSKPFNELYPTILAKLSQNIFVRESRFTWIIEQSYRFDHTMASFDYESPLTVGDFINRYNQDIQFCVAISNFGLAAQIDQAPSALNKHEAQQQQLNAPGVQELKNLEPENNNFVNRFLAFIH